MTKYSRSQQIYCYQCDGTASEAFWLVASLRGALSSEPDLINELTVIKWNINQKQLLQV
jgi:hypothetical protein